MFVRYILIKITLITCVVGVLNDDYYNKKETESKFRNLESNINQTLYKLESEILDRLISYIDGKTDALNKEIPQAINASKNEIEENLVDKITQILNASNKKIEEKLEEKITHSLDIMKKELLGKNTMILNQMPCKKVMLGKNRETPCFSMDNETLNHVSLKRNSTGHLLYFEMHVAIEADGYVAIHLMDKESDKKSNIRFEIDIGQGSNQNTALDIYDSVTTRNDVVIVHTPDILSLNTQFRAYVKIDNGKLEFGKEGNGGLLLSYEDTRFSEVNFFRLIRDESGTDAEAKFHYDCPAPVKTTKSFNRGF